MPERGDLLLAEGGAGGDRAMESAVQHGTAPFVTGLQAPGTRSNLAAATGAWRYGKRSAFPTSPHPRRRRTNVERRVTLTFHLVQKICQVKAKSAKQIPQPNSPVPRHPCVCAYRVSECIDVLMCV